MGERGGGERRRGEEGEKERGSGRERREREGEKGEREGEGEKKREGDRVGGVEREREIGGHMLVNLYTTHVLTIPL